MKTPRTVVWFSCGAASACAAKIAIRQGRKPLEVVYCDTLSTEHPDNERFFSQVQEWLGQPITKIKSSKYSSIDDVFEKKRYMAGISGAACTTEMKKLPREAFQRFDDTHIFGYTVEEERRAATFEKNNPSLAVDWPLIELGVTKESCLTILKEAGIKLPVMYQLGFAHNNCLGCVKSNSAGYWNRTRRLFPEVFERRAKQSRLLGVKLVYLGKKDGKTLRGFLDELPPDLDAPDDDIDCGPVCQTPKQHED